MSIHACDTNNEEISEANSPQLTGNDYALLENLAYLHLSAASEVGVMLRAKLQQIKIVSSNAIGPDIATLGSLIHYRLGSALDRRYLVGPENAHPTGLYLNVLSPMGILLLGQKAGRHYALKHSDETICVHLEKIEFQPEAEARFYSTF